MRESLPRPLRRKTRRETYVVSYVKCLLLPPKGVGFSAHGILRLGLSLQPLTAVQ